MAGGFVSSLLVPVKCDEWWMQFHAENWVECAKLSYLSENL